MGMKLLDRAKLEAAYITFSTIFDMALANTSVIYPRIATVITDAGPINQFKWLGDVPVMAEWLGPRVIQRLRAESHELRTKWYANGIELDYDDVNEDRLGIVRPRIEQLAQMGPRKIDAVTIDMLINGFAGTLGLTYDGQYLFDSDHTASASGLQVDNTAVTQSNLQTGALGSANYNAAMQLMMGFKSANGEPLEITPDTLLAGPTNQLVIRQLLSAQYNAAGATNVDYQTTQGIVNARINGANAGKWFLLSTGHPVRCVIVGVEYAPEFAELVGWDQEHQFFHRTMLAGAHMKVGFAYGMWQTGVGSLG